MSSDSYRARGCNAGGCGPYSATIAVTLPPTAIPMVTTPTTVSSTSGYTMGKVANGVAFLAIGTSSYELMEAARSGDAADAIGAGSDLGWSLFGLTGPVGAVGVTVYGGTSLIVEIPSINKWTVQPVAKAMCALDSGCL